VFGALTFAHVKRNKLEVQTKKYIFIGYVEGVKGYKFVEVETWEAKSFIK